MAYTPYYPNGWQNGDDGGTPITAAALNHMEDGIADVSESLTAYETGTITAVNAGGTFQQNNCYKLGKLCCVSARQYDISLPASGDWFQLPVGFRPKVRTSGSGYMMVDGVSSAVPVDVYPTGQVAMSWSASRTTTQVAFSAVFPVE